MKPYPPVHDLLRAILRVAMPWADARDPGWTTQRAVGSAAFLARYLPPRRRRIIAVPPQIQAFGDVKASGTFLRNIEAFWRLNGDRYLFTTEMRRPTHDSSEPIISQARKISKADDVQVSPS